MVPARGSSRSTLLWGIGLAVCGLATMGMAGEKGNDPLSSAESPRAVVNAPLVFDMVTVVDVERGKLLPNRRVVIVGNRIQAAGSADSVKMPAGAQVVDAKGKYLIPGVWDMLVHVQQAWTWGGGMIDSAYPLF